MSDDIIWLVPTDAGTIHQATMMLRWRKVGIGDPALQQLWIGSDGSHDWRDIEIVTEEEN